MLPNSDNWMLCHVNVTPAIINYWSYISPNTQLITDLQEQYTAPDNPFPLPNRSTAVASYNACLVELHNRFPNMIVGTYKSSRDCETNKNVYTVPRRTIAKEPIADSNLIGTAGPHAYVYDYRRKEVRDFAMPRLCNDVIATGCPLVFLDNVSNAASGWPIDWVSTMDCVKQITDRLHTAGKSVIINAAWVFGYTQNKQSIDEFLRSGADGVSLEMAYLSQVRNHTEDTKLCMAQYRRLLDAGKTLILISTGDLPRTTTDEILYDELTLATWAMMFRQPGDKLFVAHPFHLPTPTWASYPVVMGAATSDATVRMTVDGHVIVSRTFEHGSLTLDNGQPIAVSVG